MSQCVFSILVKQCQSRTMSLFISLIRLLAVASPYGSHGGLKVEELHSRAYHEYDSSVLGTRQKLFQTSPRAASTYFFISYTHFQVPEKAAQTDLSVNNSQNDTYFIYGIMFHLPIFFKDRLKQPSLRFGTDSQVGISFHLESQYSISHQCEASCALKIASAIKSVSVEI